MKKNIKKYIKENSIPWEEAKGQFTNQQKRMVESEIRYYDVLQSLKEARKKQGLTQLQLAQKAKIPRTTVTKVESGFYNPTLSTLMNMAAAMEMNLELRLY